MKKKSQYSKRIKDFLGFIAEDIQIFRDLTYLAGLKVSIYGIHNISTSEECNGFSDDICEQLSIAFDEAEKDFISRLCEKYDMSLSDAEIQQLELVLFDLYGVGGDLLPGQAMDVLLKNELF